jgi:hypothetical protein
LRVWDFRFELRVWGLWFELRFESLGFQFGFAIRTWIVEFVFAPGLWNSYLHLDYGIRRLDIEI